MVASVKISKKEGTLLERFQALLTLRAGAKVTQQEILSALIRDAAERVDELVDRALRKTLPMDDRDYEKIRSLVDEWEVETDWRDVDRILYGGHAGRGGDSLENIHFSFVHRDPS